MQTYLRRAIKIGAYAMLAVFSVALSFVVGNKQGAIEKGASGNPLVPYAHADAVGSSGSAGTGEGSGSGGSGGSDSSGSAGSGGEGDGEGDGGGSSSGGSE